MRNTAMVSPPFGGLKKCSFWEKYGLYATRIHWRGNPMGGGLLADCERKSMGFSTPFGTILSIKRRHRSKPLACGSYKNCVSK